MHDQRPSTVIKAGIQLSVKVPQQLSVRRSLIQVQQPAANSAATAASVLARLPSRHAAACLLY